MLVANVLMDTTYFGRNFGVMVFMDSFTGQVLYYQYVTYETNSLYHQGIELIKNHNIDIQSIICDGRKGLFQLFSDVPVRMCQFHQRQIITRYLTKKPKLEAAQELRELSLQLHKINRLSFENKLENWHQKWEVFLTERSFSLATGKTYYTHKKLRSAYFSLKNNAPYLFNYLEHKELSMSNTTNKLDGFFSNLKNKLRNHNSLNLVRKKKFIEDFFSHRNKENKNLI